MMLKKIKIIAMIAYCGVTYAQSSFTFNTPAYQGLKDMANANDTTAKAFYKAWDQYVNRFTTYASVYNLTGGLNYTVPGDYYTNPKNDPSFFDGAAVVPIKWQAFPGRVLHYLKPKFEDRYGYSKGEDRLFEFTDIGPEAFQKKYPNDSSIVMIPESPCNPVPSETKLFDPLGPRGWLDEYCEMGVKRDNSENITQLHFTCENPEYYWTLWRLDPKLVLNIYQQTLGNNSIKLEDLYLTDQDGNAVIERETGRAAYNPINKWNKGTVMTDTYGGAMHLTSPPNELSAEIILAGGGAVLREGGDSLNVANTLVCCSEYGRRFRHSDPHIGQNVYQVVGQNIKVSLLDPVGLYLQEPYYNYFTLPDSVPSGATIKDCFKYVRGVTDTLDFPNNMILHIVMEIPEQWLEYNSSLTLSDISILGKPIEYGSQVMQAMEVQLVAGGRPTTELPNKYDCVVANDIPAVNYFTNNNLLEASFAKGFQDSANVTPNVVMVEQGDTVSNLALVVTNINTGANQLSQSDLSNISISFPDSDINVSWNYKKLLGQADDDSNNNSYLFLLTLDIPESTVTQFYDILVKYNYPSGTQGVPVPQMMQVVPNGALPIKTHNN